MTLLTFSWPPQDPRVLSLLRAKYGDALLDHTITVCSALDLVNINMCHFIFASTETSEVRKAVLRALSSSHGALAQSARSI